MFIREKIKKHNKKQYIQHQLLKSIRTKKGPKQEVVLNLGHLDVKKEKWKLLADTIEFKLENQQEFKFLQKDKEIEKLAEHYACMIIRQAINKKSLNKDKEKKVESKEKDYERVDIKSLKTTESRSIGAEYLILNQLKAYKFDNILKELKFSETEIKYSKILIVGRAVHPSSELELSRWANYDSGICELIGMSRTINDTTLHRVAVLLWENHEIIEEKLRIKAKEIFGLKETIILYDLTNSYFEGQKKGNLLVKFGKSKERRNDCKIITLALIVDALGFPKSSRVLEGNISEPKTLEKALEEISLIGNKDEEKTIVIDAGIATEDNINLIKERKYKYVAISKSKLNKNTWKDIESTNIKLKDKKTELTLKLKKTEEESYLLCHSPQKDERDKDILNSKIKKFEDSLIKINSGLKKKGTIKKYDLIVERIGRLKERYGLGKAYNIEVIKDGDNAKEINFKRNKNFEEKIQTSGDYIIRTNRLDLKEQDISCIHRSLTMIESVFRSLKSELGLRPNFHKQEKPTIAHIFISVITYHIILPILKKLSWNGLNLLWNSVRNIMSSHDRVVTTFDTDDNHCIHICNTTKPNGPQKNIYTKLKLKYDPLQNVKIKISKSNK